jgi:hypothetical protein
MGNTASHAPLPINLTALVICDTISTDDLTGRVSALNIFHSLFAPDFPHELPPVAVYFSFSEVRRRVALLLELVDSEDNVLQSIPTEVIAPDPVAVVHGSVRFVGVKIEGPGSYFVRLFANGVYIMEKRLFVYEARREDGHEHH